MLAKIALRPRVIWVGTWISTANIAALVRSHIQNFQRDDPNALVQFATFRTFPYGEGKVGQPLTAAAQADYRAWYDQLALAIGSTHAAIILEPDLGLAWKGWRPRVRFALAAYAARVLGALPHTSVYIDASDADWLHLSQATQQLLLSGVKYVRGFALGATHYSSTAGNIAYGAALVSALARAGVPGRHFVVDTADNGRPFTWLQFYAAHPHGTFDNANVCASRAQTRCDTLGIPPTTFTASATWGMSTTVRREAARSADAFLWFGRPWLYLQANPFQLARALAVARTTPY
ncbi:MAG: Fibronectin, type domain protein [Marmoricola sp.]|nr:Fibronectin, type domain protein [Marmoricola sp.]